jgi:pimeloyl-ACP methyl ester carboxylesterase
VRPERPSDPEPREVSVDAGPVRFTDEGVGRPLVLVHGLPGSVRDFRWLAAALSGRARVLRVDLPGFGGTPAMGGRDVDARGALLAGVIEALDLRDVVVVGHSMGGPVATSAALQSDRVSALGLLASVGVDVHAGVRRLPGVRAVGYGLHVPGAARLALPALRAGFARTGLRGTDEELVQTLLVLARFRFGAHRRNLAALRKPTFVAWAADDPIVEDAIGERLYWLAPAGPRIRFPTGGHQLQATRATELADALGAWIPHL